MTWSYEEETKDMPLLSIIIPVYQAKKYLGKCTDSVLNQSFSDFELILVDDGSSDGSEKICDEYARKDNRIKTIHQKNQGVSSARNTGLEHASGEYIAFVDADDWVEPDLFQKCMKIIEKRPVDVIYHGFTKDIWKNNTVSTVKKGFMEFEGYVSREKMKDHIIQSKGQLNPQVYCYIFSRKLLDGLEFDIDMPYAEDSVFVVQALTKATSYYFIKNVDYHYNARVGSAAYRWQPKLVECYKKSFYTFICFFKTLNFSEEEISQLMSANIINGYASLIYNLCLPTCDLKLREKIKILKSARKDFEFDRYKKYYKEKSASLFEKIKTLLTFGHLEIILILLGALYCRK